MLPSEVQSVQFVTLVIVGSLTALVIYNALCVVTDSIAALIGLVYAKVIGKPVDPCETCCGRP